MAKIKYKELKEYINYSNKDYLKKYKIKHILNLINRYGKNLVFHLSEEDFTKLMKSYLMDKNKINNSIIESIYFIEDRETFDIKLIVGEYDKHSFDKNHYRFITNFKNVRRKDFHIYRKYAEVLSRQMYSESEEDDKINNEITERYKKLFGCDKIKCQEIRIIT